MTDQLISLETAKLAKEKGFVEGSKSYYNGAGEIQTWNPEFHPHAIHKNNFMQRFLYEAPTQSLLQKWLREAHEIMIVISMTSEKENTPLFYTSHVYPIRLRLTVHNIHTDQVKWSFHHNTYESALEKGLIEALKLIS